MVFTVSDQRSVLMRLRVDDPEQSLALPNVRSGLPRLSPFAHSVGLIPNTVLREEASRTRSRSALWTSPFELLITASLLSRVFRGLSSNKAAAFVDPMNLYLVRHRIDSVCRISAFFGQVAVESAGLSQMGENLHYTTAEALDKAYGRRLQGKEVSKYLGAPDRLANLVYSDRMGNGDEASGDGWRYRGRGLMQLTGRENYARFSKDTSIDALSDPDLLSHPSMAVLSACWYWGSKSLNSLADEARFQALTERINPALLHHSQRMSAMWHARDCLRSELLRLIW
jgi:putative chitinase